MSTPNFFSCSYQVSIFFILSKIDLDQYNYQCYYGYLQNQPPPPVKILKIHRSMLCIHYLIPMKILKIHRNMLFIHRHPIPLKILKIHRSMLCIHHHHIPVKILKIHHNMLCIHHPTHVIYSSFIQCRVTYQ